MTGLGHVGGEKLQLSHQFYPLSYPLDPEYCLCPQGHLFPLSADLHQNVEGGADGLSPFSVVVQPVVAVRVAEWVWGPKEGDLIRVDPLRLSTVAQ